MVGCWFLIRRSERDGEWKEGGRRRDSCFLNREENGRSIKRGVFVPFHFFFSSILSFVFVRRPKTMAANALDTLRLIGKTLVVEYNAKTPSRLKVRERERGEERIEDAAEERVGGGSEIDGEASIELLALLRVWRLS